MKRFIVLFALVAAFALLVACAPAPTPTPVPPTPVPAPKQVTITFYQRGYTAGGTDVTSVTTDKAIEIYQKNNPNVKINLVGIPWTTDGDTKLEAALAAKTDINLFRVTSVTYRAMPSRVSCLRSHLSSPMPTKPTFTPALPGCDRGWQSVGVAPLGDRDQQLCQHRHLQRTWR